jgi:hypothetical protein
MMCLCTRCGEELTAPKFYNGHPYGYSCYERVAGAKPRDKRKFVKADTVEIPAANTFELKLVVNGERYPITAYRDTNGKCHSSRAVFGDNGEVYLITHDRKGKPMWASFV